MKTFKSKIKKETGTALRESPLWHEERSAYFSSRAATADTRESRAKMMPYPTHANAFSELSAFMAKKGAGMAIPPNNGRVILYIVFLLSRYDLIPFKHYAQISPKDSILRHKSQEAACHLLGVFEKFFFSAFNGIGNFFLPRKILTIWSPSGAFRAARH
ncbi:MAG: hypothetical protein HYT13_01740 [Candidatus Liptonbacteria bacterium]|nr:hypothetical protein [Candidatus Liptonbacteria bacterium]